MLRFWKIFAVVIASVPASYQARAGALQVSPVSVEIPAPGAAATVTVQNSGTTPIYAQIRVFRWVQKDGEESLTETDAVVASPPITALQPGLEYTVRIVRTAQHPIGGTEEYRLLIDELPDRRQKRSGAIKLLVRYSIPVFFYANNSAPPNVTWRIERDNGRTWLAATNSGDRHLRLASVKITGARGSSSLGPGLLGYVLGRSKMRWALATDIGRIANGHAIKITAQTNLGPIHATASAQRGP